MHQLLKNDNCVQQTWEEHTTHLMVLALLPEQDHARLWIVKCIQSFVGLWCCSYRAGSLTTWKHKCPKNWTKPSKSMESAGVIAIASCMLEKGCQWASIMSDDDSTMWSWNKNEKRGETHWLLQPYTLGQAFCTHVYKLTSKPKKNQSWTRSMLP